MDLELVIIHRRGAPLPQAQRVIIQRIKMVCLVGGNQICVHRARLRQVNLVAAQHHLSKKSHSLLAGAGAAQIALQQQPI